MLDKDFDTLFEEDPALTIKDFVEPYEPWLTEEEVREDLLTMMYS